MKVSQILVILLLASLSFGQNLNPLNATDGIACATNVTNVWLDTAIVIELSNATALQWEAIVGNILTYLYQFTLTGNPTVAHTSRVSIFGYTSASEAELIFALTDTQRIQHIKFALNQAKPINIVEGLPNITSGLLLAKQHLEINPSFRVKGVVLYAATYDDSENSNVKVANELKADQIKIMTVSYDAANGVNTSRISALASPGLALTSLDDSTKFASAVAQLNCRCPNTYTYTQFEYENTTYAECFYIQGASNFDTCDGSSFPAVANTPARFDFITQLASNYTSEFNIGLVRNNANSTWTWEDGQAYSDTFYPPFAQPPSETDTYGYLAKSNNYNWQLLSDDSFVIRQFVCQQRACDSDHFCNI
uniref:VWFA domain-containing protein n=1 Tax=Panagrellus redivivus TaxID=6233 RepID=A0A7E4VAB8_PANRE